MRLLDALAADRDVVIVESLSLVLCGVSVFLSGDPGPSANPRSTARSIAVGAMTAFEEIGFCSSQPTKYKTGESRQRQRSDFSMDFSFMARKPAEPH